MSPTPASNLCWSHPAKPSGTGVLVLAGSSGRLDVGRADALAAAGATALALRWFGGRDQPEVPCEVALETFTEALDLLERECDLLGILGISYGAEAALLTAVRDARPAAVVAIAATDVAWEGFRRGPGDPPRSKWTWGGVPVPFVPIDPTWQPRTQPPSFLESYLGSRARADRATLAAASIPVERITGDVVLVSGGDDRVWPSGTAAAAIAKRRDAHGLATTIIDDPGAGHLLTLPGEPPTSTTRHYLVGGDDGAPERLGRLAWPAIRSALRLPVRELPPS